MRSSLTYSLWFVYILDLENELLQCEFTNELRNHREEIQNIYNHIAIEMMFFGIVDSSCGKDKLLTKFVPVVKQTRKWFVAFC